MAVLLLILGALAALGGLACTLFLLIEAFRDEVWKGSVGMLCGFYLLYFAIMEWEHDYKWPIILGSFGGSAVAAGLIRTAANFLPA